MIRGISLQVHMWKSEAQVPDGSDGIGNVLPLDIRRGTVDTRPGSARFRQLVVEKEETWTNGSPMTKVSPALIEGTRPNEPTSAAAPSLYTPRQRCDVLSETYEMISPYKFGATTTSKILQKNDQPKKVTSGRQGKASDPLWLSEHPVHHRIDQLLIHHHTLIPVPAIAFFHSPDRLSEQTIGHAEHVGFMDDRNFGWTFPESRVGGGSSFLPSAKGQVECHPTDPGRSARRDLSCCKSRLGPIRLGVNLLLFDILPHPQGEFPTMMMSLGERTMAGTKISYQTFRVLPHDDHIHRLPL